MAWWLQKWDRLRNSLWFLPGIALIIAAIGSFISVEIDRNIDIQSDDFLAPLVTTASAARSSLGTLAGGLLSVTGVVFSVAMLTMAQTSSQFGSRLLRSFMNHNMTQWTLAVFLGTSLFCIGVLRAIRDTQEAAGLVPNLSVFAAMLLGGFSLLMFVYFIHHLAQSIQAETVLKAVYEELSESIRQLYPIDNIETKEHVQDEATFDADSTRDELDKVTSQQIGYLQAVDIDALIELAAGANIIVRVVVQPGDFVFHGITLSEIVSGRIDEEQSTRIRNLFLAGPRRTPRQDVQCAIRELAEVAIRALSPGINDPHTANASIDYLTAGLRDFVQRSNPSPYHTDRDGKIRVIARPVSFETVLDTAFEEILHYGRETKAIVIQLAESLRQITVHAKRADDISAICKFAQHIETVSENHINEPQSLEAIRSKLIELQTALNATSQEI